MGEIYRFEPYVSLSLFLSVFSGTHTDQTLSRILTLSGSKDEESLMDVFWGLEYIISKLTINPKPSKFDQP